MDAPTSNSANDVTGVAVAAAVAAAAAALSAAGTAPQGSSTGAAAAAASAAGRVTSHRGFLPGCSAAARRLAARFHAFLMEERDRPTDGGGACRARTAFDAGVAGGGPSSLEVGSDDDDGGAHDDDGEEEGDDDDSHRGPASPSTVTSSPSRSTSATVCVPTSS